MQSDKKAKVREIAANLGAPPEFVEASLSVRQATTMRGKLKAFQKERQLIEKGMAAAVQRHHEQGKLTARERINRLLDPGSFEELDLWHRPYETGFDIGESSSQGDGVVVGYGTVDGRSVSVWAQDATVLGGTLGTVHARKITMIMENALKARTPVIGIVDSLGLRAHDAIQYPDYYSSSSMAYFLTMASGVIPKIALIMGPCTGETAVIANLNDFIFMTKKTSYMHLMPPPSGIDGQILGDAWNIQAKNGSCSVIAEDDEDCLAKCRHLLSYLPSSNTEKPPVVKRGDDPNRREEELLEIVPVDSSKWYNMYRLLSLVLDNGELFELKRNFARNLITGLARLDGKTVGIIANNPQDKAGCLNLDAADKMTHLVRFCDAFNIPLVWIADTPAFLPAVEEERRGLIRHGAAMVMANSEATVPQITVAVRKHYGGGRLGMPGQSLLGDLHVSWPAYEPGVMGARGAVAVIYRKELASITDESARKRQEEKRVEEMQWQLDMQIREATQMIIDPRETRPFLIRALRWLKDKNEVLHPKKHDNIRM
ncbi:acyl-CoA carboxylase subunit beta [Chloroflexota bacterium]